jgi:hypothetical protein
VELLPNIFSQFGKLLTIIKKMVVKVMDYFKQVV